MLVKKSEISASAYTPVASSSRRSRKPAVRFMTRSVDQPAEKYGLTNHLTTLAIEEVVDALRRFEEVERMARRRRVDDDQIVAAALGEHARAARSPCTPANRRSSATGAGRSGWRGCARAPRRGAWRSTSASQAPFWSSIMAVSDPLAPMPCARRGSSGYLAPRCRASQAERVGQAARRVDGHHDGAPSLDRAPERQAAAAVVLPTPPLPAEITIRCRSTTSRSVSPPPLAFIARASDAAAPPRRSPPCRLEETRAGAARRTELLREQKRQLDQRRLAGGGGETFEVGGIDARPADSPRSRARRRTRAARGRPREPQRRHAGGPRAARRRSGDGAPGSRPRGRGASAARSAAPASRASR